MSNIKDIDKRIRGRRTAWTREEREELQKELLTLPDMAEQAEAIHLAQPAVGAPVESAAGEASESN